MGFLQQLDKVKLKIILSSSGPSGEIFSTYKIGNREQFITKVKILKTVWIISLCIPSTHLTK